MIYHNWLNTGIYIEDAFKQDMREAVNYMTKKTSSRWKNYSTNRFAKTPNTEYCDETKGFEFKGSLISYLNKKYLLRHGVGGLGFITIHKNDFTIAHVYRMRDKDYVTTKRFNGKIDWKTVKQYLFKNASHIADVKKKDDKPFKTIHKQAVIPMEEFHERFKPNEQLKKSYASTAKDTALTSLSSILEDKDATELEAGTHSSALNNAFKSITFGKNSYNGTKPAVNVYAVWCNFDPESKLVNTAKFDVGEPIFYEYELIK